MIKLQLYRGNRATMPRLEEGQPAFSLDGGFFVGDGAQNIEYARADHTHPGGVFFSGDFSDLSKVKIKDGIYNQAKERLEAGEGGGYGTAD